ncbi:MAG: PBP1A family penicillin-binding protein [Pseudomonadota bacterium]
MLGGATFALLAAAVAGAAYLVASSPAPEGRIWTANRPPVVVVQAADGSEIAAFGRTAGRAVSLGDLPRHVPDAVLAAEDRNFHHHWGFNPVAWARAAIVNIRSGSVRQGGSTITQQLAKNLFLSPERTFERKLRELIYAIWLETRFSKDEILTLYLNRVYFGGGAYGIDAAAIRYFDKSARDLSVAEAATLAGLLKAPARYSPSARPGNAGARGAEVLRNMVRAGFLTRAEAEAAAREPLYLAPPDNPTAPYFADAALAEAERLLGGLEINVVVETTLEPRLQGALAAAVAGGFDGGEGEPADLEAAALVLDERGAVRALVGGRDHRRSQFNRAVAARRQPGSAFKTFVYLAGLEAGYDPYTTVLDAPIRIADWAPGNYKDRYYGEVSLEEAYARSLNSAAVRVQQAVGVRHVQQVAERLGVVSPLDKSAALALGVSETTPIELAGAYAAVANGGFSVEPHLVAAIRTPEGRPIYERAAASDRVLDPRVAFEMKEMMRATVDYGSGFRARAAAVDVGGKTGTTQSGRDGWFAGFADDYTGVVWVGRDSGGPVADLSGSREPAAIWGAFARMLSDRPRTPAGAPAVLVEAAAAHGDLDALLISLETEDPALAPYDP